MMLTSTIGAIKGARALRPMIYREAWERVESVNVNNGVPNRGLSCIHAGQDGNRIKPSLILLQFFAHLNLFP